MTLRLRFLLSLLAVIVIMAAPAIYGVSRVAEMRDIALDLREQAATSAISVGRLRSAIEQLDRTQRYYLVTTEPQDAAPMWASLNSASRELEALRNAGYEDAVASANIPLDSLRQVTARLDALVSAAARASSRDDAGAFYDLSTAATEYREIAADPLLQSATDAVPHLANAIDRHTTARVVEAERSADAATAAATTAVLIALVLAGALALAAAGFLSSPLQRLALAMARVADGDFDAPRTLPYDRADEMGDLSRSFRAMTTRLAQLDRMKAEFLGAASQGLKTPIGVIGGYAEMIRDEAVGELTPRHRQLLSALIEQADVLRRRLDQLLEMSRMESGSLVLGIEEILLRHFVNDLQREYAPRAETAQLELTVRLDEHTPPYIYADHDLLRIDILGNIVGNAIRYTPPGGAVDISVRPDGELIVFEVTDTGPGVPEDQADRIFEKHGRDPAASPGLGLAIARAAVLAHNGRIDGRNLPGGGARFRVSLPAVQSSRLAGDRPDRTPAV